MNTSNKNIHLLIASQCINKIYDIFLNTFLISFLFTKTKENIANIGIYHLISYIIVGALAYLTGNWLKRGNRLLMYQLGIIITFIFLLSFTVLQNHIINYIPLCGATYGFIVSFKSFPFNLIVADNISPSKMIIFKGYLESLKNATRIITPLLLGIFLTHVSYFKTVAFLAVMAIVEFALFAQIKKTSQKQQPLFDIKKFWRETKNLSFLKQIYQVEICRGMTTDGTLTTIITLYTIYLFKTDFNLGLISSLFYGFTIILNLIFGHSCKYRHFIKIISITTFLSILSIILFIFFPTKTSFIFYNFCFIVAVQFLRIIADINMFNIANLPEIIENKSEYFAVREIFLNLGRIFSYGILLSVGLNNNFGILKYLLIIFTSLLIVLGINCIRLNQYFKSKI